MVDVLSGSAAGWANSIVDFEERTVTVHGTVIRVTGRGLFVQAHTKTIAGMRTIRPPDWVMAIQKRRHAERACGWMSPSSTDTIPDPDNTRKAFREVVKGAPFRGAGPHDFRHYVASVPDDASLTARQIADYLGHELVSTTQEEWRHG
jgi:integrase